MLLASRQRQNRLLLQAKRASDEVEQFKLQLETVRYRTSQLREELSAANRQARLSRQLALLGQFTAGFLHEFNNPLAILASRTEVLLEERKHDAALCADLQQILKEARYMSKISGTLLQALRRERVEETFDPPMPGDALSEVMASLEPSAAKQGVRLTFEPAEVPRVNLPPHVLIEVARTLVVNALEALQGRENSYINVLLEPYHRPGASVILKVEDNGPGVPEGLREHLFEPFVSRSTNRERLGLGLFLAASLLDTYGGCIRFEPRESGGAKFIVELPLVRYDKGQPYHWSVKGISS
jgi:two-component system C4-dicarboxylate transport sensor histidine kinase DctB